MIKQQIKTPVLLLTIVACILAAWHPYVPKNRMNIHTWKIFHNSKLIFSNQYPDKKRFNCGSCYDTYVYRINRKNTGPNDFIKINYFSDFLCGNIPLIVIRDEHGNTKARFEQQNTFPMGEITRKNPDMRCLKVYYDETNMSCLLNIQLVP